MRTPSRACFRKHVKDLPRREQVKSPPVMCVFWPGMQAVLFFSHGPMRVSHSQMVPKGGTPGLAHNTIASASARLITGMHVSVLRIIAIMSTRVLDSV
jgi:hypothetical protein